MVKRGVHPSLPPKTLNVPTREQHPGSSKVLPGFLLCPAYRTGHKVFSHTSFWISYSWPAAIPIMLMHAWGTQANTLSLLSGFIQRGATVQLHPIWCSVHRKTVPRLGLRSVGGGYCFLFSITSSHFCCFLLHIYYLSPPLPWESYFYFKSNGICRKANFTHTMNLYLHIIISQKYEGIHGTETIINLFLIFSCKLGSNSVETLIKKK